MENYVPKVEIVDSSKIKVKEESNLTKVKQKKLVYDEYLGVIQIPKISLKRYLYNIDSSQNNVNKNIEVLKSSDMPDVIGGNLILAGHNGNTSAGHFRNLHKLSLGDNIIINYNGVNYNYKVDKIYDVLKTGSVAIKRDKSKNTITLITCLGSDRQLVIIGYLL